MTLEGRWGGHLHDAFKKLKSRPLYQDMRAYGAEKFRIELLEECADKLTMLDREAIWMRKLKTKHPHGYNLYYPLPHEYIAIIRYNALHRSAKQYADIFGIHIGMVRHIQSGDAYTYVTEAHLPNISIRNIRAKNT